MTASFDLADRTIIVTGGLGQLGAAFANALLDAGARVAVVDISDDRSRAKIPLQEVGEDRLRLFKADVTSKASLKAALDQIEAAWGAPYGLINNAAIDAPPDAPASENGPFEDYPESSLGRMLDVNVKGVVYCCQVFGRAMAKAGRGSIINISSIYGVLSPDQSLYQYRRDRGEDFYKPVGYSVTKSALMNLTRYLAVYWGKAGVRVNTLTFAGVFANQESAFLEPYTKKVPLGRMADPGDYEGPIVFLMSDAARYMTGANVVVDGGFTAM